MGLRCFFFQAEDGIRDIGVTGVQTCALPISPTIGRTAYISPSSAIYSHTTRAPYIRIWVANSAPPYHFDLYPHAAFTYITYCTTPFLSSWIFIFTSPSSSPRSVTIARYVPSLFQRGFLPLHVRARVLRTYLQIVLLCISKIATCSRQKLGSRPRQEQSTRSGLHLSFSAFA